MDSKLAHGLARQDIRRLKASYEPHMKSHVGLMLPAAKELNRRPKISRDDARALFARCRASHESIPGHVLTHVYADPNARPANGQFDSSALTIHAMPLTRMMEGREEKGVSLDLFASRVSRREIGFAHKRTHVWIRPHALARYHERLHGRRKDPNPFHDLSAGVCAHLGTRHILSPEIARPLVIPTHDGAFIGVSFNRPSMHRFDSEGFALSIGHGRTKESKSFAPSMFFVTEFWVNTYLHDNDLEPEQRQLLASLRQVNAETSRSMLVEYAGALFGDMAGTCLPSELAPEDVADVGTVNERLQAIRDDAGWGSLGRLVRDGQMRDLTEQAEHFRTTSFRERIQIGNVEDALRAEEDQPIPFAFGG